MNKTIQIGYNKEFALKCRLASEAGFRHVSVNFDAARDLSDSEWDRAPEHIASVLEENRLRCVQSHLPYYDLRISAEVRDERLENAIRRSIEATGAIGGPWCVWHPRSAINGGWKRSESLRINREQITEYLSLAAESGTGIALENLPIFNGIVPIMPFYTSDYEDLIELHDSFGEDGWGSDRVSICWDFGHAHLMNFDQPAAVRTVGNRIGCTHIHNNSRREDLHSTPDQGSMDWPSVMGALASTGYTGPLTLEVHCTASKDNELLLASFARHSFACLEFLESLM